MDHYTLEEKKLYVHRDEEFYEPRIGHLTDLNKAKEAFEVAISTAHLFGFDQVSLYKGTEPKESGIIAQWEVPTGNWGIRRYPKRKTNFFREKGNGDNCLLLFGTEEE